MSPRVIDAVDVEVAVEAQAFDDVVDVRDDLGVLVGFGV